MSSCQVRPLPRLRAGLSLAAAWRLVCLGGVMSISASVYAAPPRSLPGSAPAAASAPAPAASSPALNSALDAPLFYQLLIGEIEAQAGNAGNAFELMLDAARRTQNEDLFRRAIELAVQARSGDNALKAVRAWRGAFPESGEAARTQVQLLIALNQVEGLSSAVPTLLKLLPEGERSGVIASLPRHLANMTEKAKVLSTLEQALAPFINAAATRTASRVCLGELALAADKPAQALSLMQRAHADDPRSPAPILLALELSPNQAPAEALVQEYLQAPDAAAAVRLAYARQLEQAQRIAEATEQLQLALKKQPELTSGWLSLGMHWVDLRQPGEAIGALENFINRQTSRPSTESTEATEADEEGGERNLRLLDLAHTLLAQAHMQRGDWAAAAQNLNQIPPERTDLAVLTQRALLLVAQKQLKPALTLIREAPVVGDAEPRARLMAEAQVLREAKEWQAAYDLLLEGMRQAPEDTGLIYELAMVAERLANYEDMELLLRQVIRLKPNDAHAYNALGYTLAERNVRLDEARTLVQRAVDLQPNDPFILDSLGWVAYRQGKLEEALALLQRSYRGRPHAEVATHLGEVLWVSGQRDEALRVWRDGKAREADNEVLLGTLARLKVKL
jgi:tetratricopeptide (TPR) repeat protein